MSETDPTQRFSERAENYARYRPGYPAAVLDTLREVCGLTTATVVADIGSGTGILTAMFLNNGNRVYAVEPNEAMRQAAEATLGHYPSFVSIDGRAEATTLPDAGVDLVTAGQAFHWFNAAASRVEFGRILSPGGWVALVWNARAYLDDPVMSAYEEVLSNFGLGYHQVIHRSHDRDRDVLFANGYEFRAFTQQRQLDYDTFWGGFLSASYAPLPGEARYEAMQIALRDVFEAHQQNGEITFLYETHLYYGRM